MPTPDLVATNFLNSCFWASETFNECFIIVIIWHREVGGVLGAITL